MCLEYSCVLAPEVTLGKKSRDQKRNDNKREEDQKRRRDDSDNDEDDLQPPSKRRSVRADPMKPLNSRPSSYRQSSSRATHRQSTRTAKTDDRTTTTETSYTLDNEVPTAKRSRRTRGSSAIKAATCSRETIGDSRPHNTSPAPGLITSHLATSSADGMPQASKVAGLPIDPASPVPTDLASTDGHFVPEVQLARSNSYTSDHESLLLPNHSH